MRDYLREEEEYLRKYEDSTNRVIVVNDNIDKKVRGEKYKIIHESKLIINGKVSFINISETTVYKMWLAEMFFNFMTRILIDKYDVNVSNYLGKIKNGKKYLM